MNSNSYSRRHFLRRTLHASAAAAMPAIVPASVLGGGGTAPSDRISVGCIGTGEQGRGVMQNFLAQPEARVVAVCDVKRSQRELARDLVNNRYQNRDCVTYDDFRELCERRDIDVVLVATPDHWHVLAALEAARSGKDLYVEKPMGVSLGEGQALREAVRKFNRVFQFGTQQRSDRNFRHACELVRNGRLGRLQHINVWAPGSVPGGPTDVVPIPEGFDYDFWLGPAPFTPHTRHKCSNNSEEKTWWFMEDYTLGFLSGWGVHPMDIACWGAAPWMTGPVRMQGKGNIPSEGACNTATTWDVHFEFNGGLTMHFRGVPLPSNTTEGYALSKPYQDRYGQTVSHGTAFEGTEGWVCVDRNGIRTHPAELTSEKWGPGDVRLTASDHHVRNLLENVRRRAATVCPIEEAVVSDSYCQISDIAIRLQRPLTWDPQRESFPDDSEANERLRVRSMRSPWSLM